MSVEPILYYLIMVVYVCWFTNRVKLDVITVMVRLGRVTGTQQRNIGKLNPNWESDPY